MKLKRCVELPVADTEQILLQKLLEAMNSSLPDECEAAAEAVFATYSGPSAHLVGLAVKRLIANRRALQTTVRALQAALTWSRGQLLPPARAVLEALATDPPASNAPTIAPPLALTNVHHNQRNRSDFLVSTVLFFPKIIR